MMLYAIFAGLVVACASVFGAVYLLRKRHDRRLGYMAQYDQLTGLINRALFQDRLDSALARARREGGLVTVMFLDIDGFKGVNDRFGHAVGDELLRQVAARLHGPQGRGGPLASAPTRPVEHRVAPGAAPGGPALR